MNSRLGRREESPNLALIVEEFFITFKIFHTIKVIHIFNYFPRNFKYKNRNFQEIRFEFVCFIF